jgi:hypothetical protein
VAPQALASVEERQPSQVKSAALKLAGPAPREGGSRQARQKPAEALAAKAAALPPAKAKAVKSGQRARAEDRGAKAGPGRPLEPPAEPGRRSGGRPTQGRAGQALRGQKRKTDSACFVPHKFEDDRPDDQVLTDARQKTGRDNSADEIANKAMRFRTRL